MRFDQIKAEIVGCYDELGLTSKPDYDSQMEKSLLKVVDEAFFSSKRLFLHKLRNQLITHPSGLKQFNPSLAGIVPKLIHTTRSGLQIHGYQVQSLYIQSKDNRKEGCYKPSEDGHSLLCNFAWIYAGIKNGALTKAGQPKPVNLMLANPTNLPENSAVNSDKLYRKGDPSHGLSALGYEMAFLQAAGFVVRETKLDSSSGLTKIKLLPPPEGAVPRFKDILTQVGRGFLQDDHRASKVRRIDVGQFITQAKADPKGWGRLIPESR